ncbi:carboxypeptidase-like regulatory domain-containing protein [Aestuariirhabdus sp. Z084]|uniref:carboxypeptidase-like regulatory domain-containing protein n=1 Tax=Aestuariirhabdus haliotis TaxID=2918751 RepID=UPI00201B4185|nr:carboxypeptidase-like regulatory domain-containing protein [Aestuariirhabdus haliotis]MCL6416634.1 carboxypeptidase-like regulatory domain-containing protein [Aestuariirhabdus haliotis]MCL6420669.1 carboxypeptidase-like regulatory domain-containing protein [Aestuariirhabdus haliotis]
MSKRSLSLSLLAAVSLLLSSASQAHLIKVFAYASEGRIEGTVYFAGGDPVSGARIKFKQPNSNADIGSDNEQLTDAKGRFSLTRPTLDPILVVANTGDGHVAEWLIDSVAAPASIPAHTQPSTSPAESHSISSKALEDRIEQALARQLAPLRLELQQQASRARLSDILGGLGTLIGIAGALLWWRSRQPQP